MEGVEEGEGSGVHCRNRGGWRGDWRVRDRGLYGGARA